MMWSKLSVSRMRGIVTALVVTIAATSFPVLKAGGTRGEKDPAPRRASKLDRELQQHVDRRGETLQVIITSARGRRSAALEKRRAHGDVIGADTRSSRRLRPRFTPKISRRSNTIPTSTTCRPTRW